MSTNNSPIRRHALLQPLSRDHHHALLLVWKIRTGLRKNREISRINKYIRWFYTNYLCQHFTTEENLLYPILGNDHPLIKLALDEHRQIRRLIESNGEETEKLDLLANLIEQHVRFEERTLFNEIQQSASDSQLKQVQAACTAEGFVENDEDKFWE